ncbi:hypothetical protein Pcinc_030749 [Petrolisthes cinctipes]|uniref:Major facilitator superfamily (MFS) profile domain-containing protein n=1 Tax=Petrolisthes cinctipes TaxID=88211 RepID=A0AAE1EY31_PETCI|nr:hypothetical protein Pcinc_030749 [Petrolisthes cinctipes]
MTYASEIADTSHRGSFVSVNIIMFLLGIVSGAALGMIFTWYEVALFSDGLLLLAAFIVPFLPESPTFLVVTDRHTQAAEILRRLRGYNCNIENEILMIKEMNNTETKSTWRDIFRGDNIKRLLILFGLFCVQSFSGVHVLRSNLTRILQSAGINSDLELWTTVILLVPVGGSILQTLLIDRLGRRLCLVVSLAPTTVFCFSLGVFSCLYDQVEPNGYNDLHASNGSGFNETGQVDTGSTGQDVTLWFPVLFLSACILGMHSGIEALPWQLSSEYFTTTMRPMGITISNVLGCLVIATSMQCYSLMRDSLTMAGLYFFYSTVAFLGIIFTLFCVPETTGENIG